MIDFISFVAQHNDEAGQAVLDGGFLDMLLRIYVLCPTFDFKDTNEQRVTLSDACASALSILSRQPHHLEVILSHPICALWTQCRRLFRIQDTLPDFVSARRVSWRSMDRSFFVRRLGTIYKLLSKPGLGKTVATEICCDLVEFSQ